MSKDAFWALIQEAKTACGQDLNAMEDYLREQLVSMGPAAAKNFHDILQTYEDLADQYGLWDAVSVIKEYGCSDDGFIDFRAWLIAQGKEGSRHAGGYRAIRRLLFRVPVLCGRLRL